MGCGASTNNSGNDRTVGEEVAQAARDVKDALVVQKDHVKQQVKDKAQRAYNFLRGIRDDHDQWIEDAPAPPPPPPPPPAADEAECAPSMKASESHGRSRHKTPSDDWERFAMMYPDLDPVTVRRIVHENSAAGERAVHKKLEEADAASNDTGEALVPLGDGGGEPPAHYPATAGPAKRPGRFIAAQEAVQPTKGPAGEHAAGGETAGEHAAGGEMDTDEHEAMKITLAPARPPAADEPSGTPPDEPVHDPSADRPPTPPPGAVAACAAGAPSAVKEVAAPKRDSVRAPEIDIGRDQDGHRKFYDKDTAAQFASWEAERTNEQRRLFCWDADPDDDACSGIDGLAPPRGSFYSGKHVSGIFADAFITNTEIEGGGVDMRPFIDAFRTMLDEHAVGHSPYLPRRLFKNADRQYNTPVCKLLKVAARATGPGAPTEEGVAAMRERIEGLSKDNPMLWVVTGWPSPSPGHAVHWVVVWRAEGFYDVVYINSAGIAGCDEGYPKGRGYTRVCIPNVPKSRLCASAALLAHARIGLEDSAHSGMYMNTVLFPMLQGRPVQFLPPDFLDDKPAWGGEELGVVKSPQKAGTCYIKGTLMTIHYILGAFGMHVKQQKAVFALLRLLTLDMVTADLKAQKKAMGARYCISVSEYKILEIAQHQVVNAAVKAFHDWPRDGGLIDSGAFAMVSTSIAAVREALPAKILDAVRVTQPRVAAIDDTTAAVAAMSHEHVVAHDGFDLAFHAYAGDSSVASFAGRAEPAQKPLNAVNLQHIVLPPTAACAEVRAALSGLSKLRTRYLENPSGAEHPLGGSLRKCMYERIIFDTVGPPPPLAKGALPKAKLNVYWASVVAATEAERVELFHVWCMVSRQYMRAWAGEWPVTLAGLARRTVGQFALFCIIDGFIRAGVGPTSAVLHKHAINPMNLKEVGDIFTTMRIDDPVVADARAAVLAYTASLPSPYVWEFFNDARPNNEYWTEWQADGKGVDDGVGELFRTQCKLEERDLNLPSENPCKKADYLNLKALCINAPGVPLGGDNLPSTKFLWPGYRDAAMMCRFVTYRGEHRVEGSDGSMFGLSVDPPQPTGKMRTMLMHGHMVLTKDPSRSFKMMPWFSTLRPFHEATRTETEVVANSTDTPWFPDTLSREEGEVLSSLLATPYLRIPLLVEFFLQLSNLSLPTDVEEAFVAMCCEPGAWARNVRAGGAGGTCTVPLTKGARDTAPYATPTGLLRQEWTSNADTMQGVLQQFLARVTMEEEAAAPYDGPVLGFLFAIRLAATLRRFGNNAAGGRVAYDGVDDAFEAVGRLLGDRIRKAHAAVYAPMDDVPADEQPREVFRRLQHVVLLLLHRALLYGALPKSPHRPLAALTAVVAVSRIGVEKDKRISGFDSTAILPLMAEDVAYAHDTFPGLPAGEKGKLMNTVVDLVCGPGTSDPLKGSAWTLQDGVARCRDWAVCLNRGVLSSAQGSAPSMLPAGVVKHPSYEHVFGAGTALVADIVFECEQVIRFKSKFNGMDFELDFWKRIKCEEFFKRDGVVKIGGGGLTIGQTTFDKPVAPDTYPKEVAAFLKDLLGKGKHVLGDANLFKFYGIAGEGKKIQPFYRFASAHAPSGCAMEMWVVNAFARPCAHVLLVCEEGRRVFRKLVWTSNYNYALATLVPNAASKRSMNDFAFDLRGSAGINLAKFEGDELFSEDSLVIRVLAPDAADCAYEMLPQEVLYGVLPEGLLECRPDPAVETPIDDPKGLIPPAARRRNFWIKRSRAAVWRPDGHGKASPAPPSDVVEILGFSLAALQAGTASRASAIAVDIKPSGTANIRYGNRQLLDSAFACNKHAGGAVEVMARLDALSHVLQWWADGTDTPEFELPRVQVEFGYARVATMDGVDEIRLMSKSHNRLFVSNQRGPHLWDNLYGLPHSVLLESEAGALSVLVPSCEADRPQVEGAPLHTHILLDRSSVAHIPAGSPRTYLVPVHTSCERLVPETVESALYVMNMRLLHRAYASAANLASVCHVDHPFSPGERRVLSMFKPPLSSDANPKYDSHPDHVAVVLRLVLALGFCSETVQGVEKPLCYQWSTPSLLTNMASRLRHVSVGCRLTMEEIEQLLDTRIAFTDDQTGASASTPVGRLKDAHEKLGAWMRNAVDAKVNNTNDGYVEMNGKVSVGGAVCALQYNRAGVDSWLADRRSNLDHLIKYNHVSWWGGMMYVRYDRPPMGNLTEIEGAWRRLYKDDLVGKNESLGLLFLYEVLAGHLRVAENGFEPAGLPDGSLLGRAMLGGMCVRMKKAIDPNSEQILQLLKLVAHLPPDGRRALPKVPVCEELKTDTAVVNHHVTGGKVQGTILRPFFDALFAVLETHRDHLKAPNTAHAKKDERPFKYLTRLPFRYFRIEQSNTAQPSIELRQLYLGDPASVFVHLPFKEARALATTPLALTVNTMLKRGPAMRGGGCDKDDRRTSAVQGAPLHAAAFRDSLADAKSAEARGVQRLLDCAVAEAEGGGGKSPLDVALRRAHENFTLWVTADIDDIYGVLEELRQALLHQQQLDRRAAFAARLWATELAARPHVDDATVAQQHEVLMQRLMLATAQAPRVTLAELAQVATSTAFRDDLQRGNPWLAEGACGTVLDCSTVALLRFCRVEQIGRCLLQLADALRAMEEAKVTERLDEANAAITALLAQLFATRQYVQLSGEGRGHVHATLDPRYLAFEYNFGVVLWKRQLDLTESLLAKEAAGQSSVVQLLMGQGKSAVVSPLMTLPLTERLLQRGEGGVLVACCPKPLVRQALAVLGGRFTAMTDKTPLLFECDRARGDLAHLAHKVETAAKFGNILIASPESLKSCLLRCAEKMSNPAADTLPPGHVVETAVAFRCCINNGRDRDWSMHIVTRNEERSAEMCTMQHSAAAQLVLRPAGKGWLILPAALPGYALAVADLAEDDTVPAAIVPLQEDDDRQRWSIIGGAEGKQEFIVASLATFTANSAMRRVLGVQGSEGKRVMVGPMSSTPDIAALQRWSIDPVRQAVTCTVLTEKVGYTFTSCLTEKPLCIPWGRLYVGAETSCRWTPPGEVFVVKQQAGGAVSVHPRRDMALAWTYAPDQKEDKHDLKLNLHDPSSEHQQWVVGPTPGGKLKFQCKARGPDGGAVGITAQTERQHSLLEVRPVDVADCSQCFTAAPVDGDALLWPAEMLIRLSLLRSPEMENLSSSGLKVLPGGDVTFSDALSAWTPADGQWCLRACPGMRGWYYIHTAAYEDKQGASVSTACLTAVSKTGKVTVADCNETDASVAERQRWQRVMTQDGTFLLTCQAFRGEGDSKPCVTVAHIGPNDGFVFEQASYFETDVTKAIKGLQQKGKIKLAAHERFHTRLECEEKKNREQELVLVTSIGSIVLRGSYNMEIDVSGKQWFFKKLEKWTPVNGKWQMVPVKPVVVRMVVHERGKQEQLFIHSTARREWVSPLGLAEPPRLGATVHIACKAKAGFHLTVHGSGAGAKAATAANHPSSDIVVQCGASSEGYCFQPATAPSMHLTVPQQQKTEADALLLKTTCKQTQYRTHPDQQHHDEWLIEASTVLGELGIPYSVVVSAQNPTLAWTYNPDGDMVELSTLDPGSPSDAQLWKFTQKLPPAPVGNAVASGAQEVDVIDMLAASEGGDDAAHLASIAKHFRAGVVLVDEVDSIMAPMTSELNFPVGREDLVPLGRKRWQFAIKTIERCLPLLREGLGSKSVQSSPHLALVDHAWYVKNLVAKVAERVLDIIGEEAPSALTNRSAAHAFLSSPSAPIPPELAKLDDADKQMLCLGRQWTFHLFPHVTSKVSRVNYGLAADPKRLVSVPFLAKDVPSERSEFAHPDIVIGLAYLSYHYEGLRYSDVKNIVEVLVRDVGLEKGPPANRPTYALFESFLGSFDPDKRPVPPIHMVNLDHATILVKIHAAVSKSPKAALFYLDTVVFPQTLKFATRKLTACGQELGNSIMFSKCLGFTGTSDDLVPSAIEPVHAIADTAAMIQTLSSPVVSSAVELPQRWDADVILDIVAQKRFDALIDAGGLITAYPNEAVASLLLLSGPSKDTYYLHHKDVVVFLDAQTDRPLFISRTQRQPRPLGECTTPLHRRFVFFDQVHCTGTDVKQANDANAALLMGKDMTFRDLAQAAWRMRKLGPSGQHLVMHVPPELHLLAKQHVAGVPTDDGWEPTLLNVVLTHCVRHGAAKVRVNEMKLREQEAGAPRRRAAVAKLIVGEDTEGAFEESVDHSVQMSSEEGALDSEVVQQQQQEEQKEQQKVLMRVSHQHILAEHKQYSLAALAALSAADLTIAHPLRCIAFACTDATETKGAKGGRGAVKTLTFGDLRSENVLITGNFLRVAGKTANAKAFGSDSPIAYLRNVYAVLRLADGKTCVGVCLDEADAIRRHLTFNRDSAPANLALLTRKGSVLACSGAGTHSPPAVYRFFNGDLWYTDDDVKALADAFGVQDVTSPVAVRLRQILGALGSVRRRENVNLDSSSLVGEVISNV